MKNEQLAFNFWYCALWSQKYGTTVLENFFTAWELLGNCKRSRFR